ncbi:rapamycin-insensitive companion of mTOR isoform X1, partial [Silurus asotus]
DTEEALMMNLRDSQILNHKQNLDWSWVLIGTILKWPNVNLRNNKDEQMHKFVRRLLFFYKPSSKLYASLELDHSKAKQLTVVGCQFVEFLLESDEDGLVYLEDLVKDIVQWLSSSSGLKPDRSLQSNGLLNTLSQHYFLFLGTLSAHPSGVKLLEKCSVFQW